MPALTPTLSIGDQVLYRVGGTDARPQLRPAFVVALRSKVPNLTVLLDGPNDSDLEGVGPIGAGQLAVWRGSVARGEQVGQWRSRTPKED